MKFTLAAGLDSFAASEHEDRDCCDACCGHEIGIPRASAAEMLRKIAEEIESSDGAVIRDHNGNTIGSWEITSDPAGTAREVTIPEWRAMLTEAGSLAAARESFDELARAVRAAGCEV